MWGPEKEEAHYISPFMLCLWQEQASTKQQNINVLLETWSHAPKHNFVWLYIIQSLYKFKMLRHSMN